MAAGLLTVLLEQEDGTVEKSEIPVFGGDGIPLPIAIMRDVDTRAGIIARYDRVTSGGTAVCRDDLPLYRFSGIFGSK